MVKYIVVLLCVLTSTAIAADLIVNGDFSAGTSNWTIIDGGVYSYGSNALKVWATEGLWDVGFAFQEIGVTPGEIYAMNANVLNPSAEPLPGTGGTAFIKLEFYNGTGTIINGPYGTTLDIINGTFATNTWLPLSGSMIAPGGAATVKAVLMVQDAGGGTSVAWFDNAFLGGPALPVINSPDYDGINGVNMADFTKLAGVWGQQSSTYNLAGSEFIDAEDLTVMGNAWLSTIPVYPGYTLAWSDEFYGPEIDSSNWTHEIGTGTNGWGNWEWEYYTDRPENSRIEDGVLVIEARKESYGGKNYTSARLKTQGKQSFMYGKIEARIKLPAGGNGIWPAFWMLGDNVTSIGWPQCGELDILEMMEDPFTAVGAIHYGSSDPYIHNYHSGSYTTATNLSDDFHVYGVEWDETEIRWYRDGFNYHTSSNSWAGTGAEQEVYPAPFNQNFFIILNFAVGASWATEDPDLAFPQKYYVDYVRVYEKTIP